MRPQPSIWVVIGLAWLGSIGCRPDDLPPVSQRPAGVGPGDSLAKLSRMLLLDSNPVAVAQAISCEHGRLIRLHGGQKAHAIARAVRDTIYSWRDRAALRQVDAKLANHVFDTDCGHPLGSDSSPPRSLKPR